MDKPRENAALVIAASIVAAIQLRGQEMKPSPRVKAIIYDAVQLARQVMAEVERREG